VASEAGKSIFSWSRVPGSNFLLVLNKRPLMLILMVESF